MMSSKTIRNDSISSILIQLQTRIVSGKHGKGEDSTTIQNFLKN